MNYDRANIVGGGNSSEGVRIITVGDIMLARKVGEKIRQNKSSTFLTEKVGDIFDSSDIALGNLESPICETATKTGAFKAPSESAGVVKNFSVVSLANNHIFDCGDEGIKDTIGILVENNVNYAGIGTTEAEAYKPTILNIKSKAIAVFACTSSALLRDAPRSQYEVALIENNRILKNIQAVRNEVYFTILLFHGGDEFIAYPPPSTRNNLRDLAFNGVDLIVGHHPHILSGYEKIGDDKLIWYSLGDFIFDSPVESRRRSGILSLSAHKHHIGSFELIPTYIDDSLQVTKAGGKLSESILTSISARSAKLHSRSYEKDYAMVYAKEFLRFQIERLRSILKRKGLRHTAGFLLSRARYFPYHVSKLLKNKRA
jgi:poly-gamma-glutamate synthesis protein (capsule biosynthesis protein)